MFLERARYSLKYSLQFGALKCKGHHANFLEICPPPLEIE